MLRASGLPRHGISDAGCSTAPDKGPSIARANLHYESIEPPLFLSLGPAKALAFVNGHAYSYFALHRESLSREDHPCTLKRPVPPHPDRPR